MKLFRNIIFWLHLSAGCVASVVILTMAVTGILLAFERQVTSSVNTPAVLQEQSESTPLAGVEAIVKNLQSSGRGIPTELVLHNSTKAPVEARFGRESTLFLNPWTGEVIGQPSEGLRGFFGSVENIHRSLGLGLRNAIGRSITGAANFVFLFMLISGMFLWMPKVFTLAGFKGRVFFRAGLKGRTREWNWHHVAGIWSAIPLFFIVLTGVIMSYPWASNLLFSMTGSSAPTSGFQGERGPRGNHGGQHSTAFGYLQADAFRGIDLGVQIARQQTPEWKSITVTVPRPQEGFLNLYIDKSVGGQPEQAYQLVIDRQSGKIEAEKRFSDNSTGQKLRAWARFLHTGEELGLFGQIVAALACVGAVLLVWTGFSMSLRRAFARFELAREEPEAIEREERAVSI